MWLEKFNKDKKEKIKKLTFNFADIKKGQKMLVSSPKSISNYIKKMSRITTSRLLKGLINKFIKR